MKKHKIKVVTRLQDNGDGSSSMFVYNNHEEMFRDHPMAEVWDEAAGKYQCVELTQEQKDSILSGEDSYENGYVGEDEIGIIQHEDGTLSLEGSLCFHGG